MSALAADGLPPLREVIARHGLSARRALGQNFLLDLNLTARIARASGPLVGATVVEIGPGPGGLTRSTGAQWPGARWRMSLCPIWCAPATSGSKPRPLSLMRSVAPSDS